MKKILLLIIAILLTTNSYAAAPTRAYTYVSNTTIDPVQNNANENALYSYLQTGVDTYAASSITGAAISASASIPYISLSLSNSIVNADISSSAGILGSKLDLTSPGIIGSATPSTGKFTNLTITGTLNSGITNQGDIFYDNGTSIVRLPPSTVGTVLQTGGALANPSYVNGVSSFLDYGSSASVSTSRQATAIKIATGSVSVGSSSTQAITNLLFTSSSSYYCQCTYSTNTAVNENPLCTPNSGAQMTIKNDQASTRPISWFCVGI